METRYNEVKEDWQNVIVITWDRYIGFFSTRFTTTELMIIVRYTGVFVISGNQRYMEILHVGVHCIKLWLSYTCQSLSREDKQVRELPPPYRPHHHPNPS